MNHKTQELQRKASDDLGPHWARRLNACLDTLIDAEPVIHDAAGTTNVGNALADVCDALRTVLEEKRF